MKTMDSLERIQYLRRELENPAFSKGHHDSFRDDCDGRPRLDLSDEALREDCYKRYNYTTEQADAWVRGYRDSALSARACTYWMVLQRY